MTLKGFRIHVNGVERARETQLCPAFERAVGLADEGTVDIYDDDASKPGEANVWRWVPGRGFIPTGRLAKRGE